MTAWLMDLEDGDNLNGGTSFDILASGTDGVFDGAYNFNSAAATFTVGMVGHCVRITTLTYGVKYVLIAAFVDEHNLTLEPRIDGSGNPQPWAAEGGMSFCVGGRWKEIDRSNWSGSYGNPRLWTPDDEWRIKATAAPFSVGDATWSSTQKYVEFATALAADIEQATANWTTANGGLTNQSYSRIPARIGTTASKFRLPSSPVVSQKYWYKALSATLDLSTWSRVCLFRYGGHTSGVMELHFCSDSTGSTSIGYVTLPVLTGSASAWQALTLDYGGPLPSGINSLSVRTGGSAPPGSTAFCLTNIIAVKAAGDPLEFTLSHLMGKVHNRCWGASTSYALDAIRKPTQPSRNGFRYKVTVAGTSGASEPEWPLEEGETVEDGTVTWECEGPEDTWYGCLCFTGGTRFTIDHGEHLRPHAVAGVFFTEDETVDTWLRLPLPKEEGLLSIPGEEMEFTAHQIMSGGWSRTDMSVMDEETWLDGKDYTTQTGVQQRGYSEVRNISAVRYFIGAAPTGSYNDATVIRNSHFNCNNTGLTGGDQTTLYGVVACTNNSKAIGNPPNATQKWELYQMLDMHRCRFDNNLTNNWITREAHTGAGTSGMPYAVPIMGRRHSYVYARGNRGNLSPYQYNFALMPATPSLVYCRKFRSYTVNSGMWQKSGRFQYAVETKNTMGGRYVFNDYQFHPGQTGYGMDEVLYVGSEIPLNASFLNHNGSPGVHKLYRYGCTVYSETGAHRRTGTGIAWRVVRKEGNPTSSPSHPWGLPPFRVPLRGGEATTIKIWAKFLSSENTYAGVHPIIRLRCRGGQIAGVPDEVYAEHSGTADTWEELSITVTASVSGVVEVDAITYPMQYSWSAGASVYFDDFSF